MTTTLSQHDLYFEPHSDMLCLNLSSSLSSATVSIPRCFLHRSYLKKWDSVRGRINENFLAIQSSSATPTTTPPSSTSSTTTTPSSSAAQASSESSGVYMILFYISLSLHILILPLWAAGLSPMDACHACLSCYQFVAGVMRRSRVVAQCINGGGKRLGVSSPSSSSSSSSTSTTTSTTAAPTTGARREETEMVEVDIHGIESAPEENPTDPPSAPPSVNGGGGGGSKKKGKKKRREKRETNGPICTIF